MYIKAISVRGEGDLKGISVSVFKNKRLIGCCWDDDGPREWP